MNFSAGLKSFYKAFSKKFRLNIWVPILIQWYEYTLGTKLKLQQPGYYDFSTLIFSNYAASKVIISIKHLYWENFS